MISTFLSYNYLKTAGANIFGWWNVAFQSQVTVSGESFRVWASFYIAIIVGILTAIKIIKDITTKK